MSAMTKQEWRRRMMSVRRTLTEVPSRSVRIWDAVDSLEEIASATVVLAYATLPGEPASEPFLARLRERGARVLVPGVERTAPPPDLRAVEVAVVPGVAFSRDGHRLGRGAGWYDRVLVELDPAARCVGVCFAEQLVEQFPVEPHDVLMDLVVTDREVIRVRRLDRS